MCTGRGIAHPIFKQSRRQKMDPEVKHLAQKMDAEVKDLAQKMEQVKD